MARRGQQATAQGAAEATSQDVAAAIQAETLDELHGDALQQFLDQIDDEEAEIWLYRLNPGKGKRAAYLFCRGVAEVTMTEILESLRDDYGGGSFRLEVRNQRGYIAAKYIDVEAPKRPLPGHDQERDRGRDRDRDRDRDYGGGVDFSPLIDLIERSNAQHRDTLNTLVQAMKPERRDVGEMVESLAALDRLRPTPTPASSGMGVKDLLEAFQLFETIRGGGSDDGGVGSTGWDVLRSAVGSFFPMLQAGLHQQQLPPGAPALTYAPASGQSQPGADPANGATQGAPVRQPVDAGAAGGAPEPDPQARAAMADNMQRQLELLLRAAAENRDPWTYASLAIDELGAEASARLFLDPQGWAAFATQVPAVVQFGPWFDEFRQELGAIYASVREEGQDGVSAGEHGADVTDHGHVDGPAPGGGGHPPDPGDHGEAGGAGETGSAHP